MPYIDRSLRLVEGVLTRLRIGHTRLTHSYLLEREDQPLCISCNEPFTVKHSLIDCFQFSHVRPHFFFFFFFFFLEQNDLRYLFEDVPADNTRFQNTSIFLTQEAHGPRFAHLSDIATADMQM